MTELHKHLDDDVLLDLGLGLADPVEREGLREHLVDCAECENRLRQVVSDRTRHAARRVSVPERTGRRRAPGVLPFRRRESRRFAVPVALAAAAMALLLLWPERGPRSPELPWLETPGDRIHHRDDPAPPAGDLEAGLEAYARRDPEEAIRRLEAVRAEGARDHLRRIYLGNALARVGRWEEAVEALAPVPLDVVPDPWGMEARWTLFLALRETGRPADADSLLHVLAREPGPVGERARMVIETP